jgi:hypothetical protein
MRILPKALHDRGAPAMQTGIQQEIDSAGPGYDIILLGYALCGNGLIGLTARDTPLIAPRAHDCITLLLGSRARHEREVLAHPGTIFRSIGWVEHNVGTDDQIQRTTGAGLTLEALIARYGEDNGRYLHETLYQYRERYSRLVYLNTSLDDDAGFRTRASSEAAESGWRFETMPGSLDWINELLAGPWPDERFLTVPPGCTIEARHDGTLTGLRKPAE